MNPNKAGQLKKVECTGIAGGVLPIMDYFGRLHLFLRLEIYNMVRVSRSQVKKRIESTQIWLLEAIPKCTEMTHLMTESFQVKVSNGLINPDLIRYYRNEMCVYCRYTVNQKDLF